MIYHRIFLVLTLSEKKNKNAKQDEGTHSKVGCNRNDMEEIYGNEGD